jgi:hypothetical protein
MNSVAYRLGNALVALAEDGFVLREGLENQAQPASQESKGYDLDLLYVECRFCGKPVLWEKGKTSLLVRSSGIDISLLDEECMIISEGCPNCRPGLPFFQLQLVRVAVLSPHDIMLLGENKGSA